jgi:hypothetical protein
MKPDAWLIIYGLSIGGPTAGFILFSFIRQLNTSLLHMLPTPGAWGYSDRPGVTHGLPQDLARAVRGNPHDS